MSALGGAEPLARRAGSKPAHPEPVTAGVDSAGPESALTEIASGSKLHRKKRSESALSEFASGTRHKKRSTLRRKARKTEHGKAKKTEQEARTSTWTEQKVTKTGQKSKKMEQMATKTEQKKAKKREHERPRLFAKTAPPPEDILVRTKKAAAKRPRGVPVGWARTRDEDGKPYYYNIKTKETRRTPPGRDQGHSAADSAPSWVGWAVQTVLLAGKLVFFFAVVVFVVAVGWAKVSKLVKGKSKRREAPSTTLPAATQTEA